ncbi:MAG: PrsW family intramembrane metalloprotease [Solirubrobacterales bacterium]|nr:PrsW family intramembrane metalloprotease [Solirubrobacterales bacterium]
MTVVAEPAPSAPDAGRERRREALALSGWGRPLKLVQPGNPCFWVFLGLTVWGFIQMWKQWTNVDVSPATTISAVVLLGLYGVALALIFLNVDRYARQPSRLLAAAFLWGGVAATFGIAIGANDALSGIYGKLFGHAFVTDWWAALSAPFVEESAKAAGFLLLLGLAPNRIRSVCDALLVGAFLGLGFEILEDLLYTFNAAIGAAGSDQVGAAIQMVIIRSATGLFSHALYTALFCAGLIYVIGTPALARKTGRGIFLMAAAVIAHAVWDGAGAIADGSPLTIAVSTVIVVAGLAVFVYVFRRAVPQERAWMHDVLAPEESDGTLTSAELEAAAGTRRQRKSFVKAPEGKKTRKGRRGRRRLIKAVDDLAHSLAESGGDDSPAVDAARGRVATLRAAT